MNSFSRLLRASSAMLALFSLGIAAAQGQSPLVPLMHRHFPVRPRLGTMTRPAVGSGRALPSWSPSAPLVPRALPTV